MPRGPKAKTEQEVFLALKNRAEITSDNCWLLHGGTTVSIGYKRVGAAGKQYYAHRLAYLVTKGAIPQGMCVCHSCDNPNCINPDHLWLGTNKENHDDKVKKGRGARGETHFNSKLTEEAVKLIRANPQLPAKDLAKVFGVTKDAINRIRRGVLWRHIHEK